MPLSEKKVTEFGKFLSGFADKLPPEKYAQLQQVFGDPAQAEQAVDYAAQHVMLRQDYFTNNAQLNAERAEFERQRAAANEDIRRIAEYDAQLQDYEAHLRANAVPLDAYNAIQQEKAALEAFKQQAQLRLHEMGLDELIPTSTEPNGVPMPTPTNPNQPPTTAPVNNGSNGSPVRYITETQFAQRLNESSLAAPLLAAQLADVAAEYQALTGKPLQNQQQLIVQAIQSGKSFTDFADEALNLPDLRKQAASAAYEADIKRRVQEEVSKLTSENRLPTMGGRDYEQSPIMQNLVAQQVNAQSDVLAGKPQSRPGAASTAATQAYLSGKYKDQRM